MDFQCLAPIFSVSFLCRSIVVPGINEVLVKSLYLLLQSQNCLPCQGFLFPRNTLHINEIKRVFIEVMSQAFRLTSLRSVDGCGVADLSSYLAFVLRKAEEKKNKEAFYMKLRLKKSVDLKKSCFFLAGLFYHVMGQLVLLCMMAELVLSGC